MTGDTYCAIYDFELMPYALGDVLTWNVLSAIRCERLGRECVDAYVCLDERFPSNIYQRDFVTAENSGVLFNELFGAFGTHPKPGSVHLFRRRERLLEKLHEIARGDAAVSEAVDDYEQTLAQREDGHALVRYFRKHVHSHDQINAYFAEHGRIPLLRPSLGCGPDVASLLSKKFAGKRIVAIHVRMRRLDIGYGGDDSYARDSDFLEWYEFLREAGERYPDVQFVALGRTQEKPLELLNLPNVSSLRTWGLGLGHELTLMLRSDLFIGASSGFAAMAYFSEIPYAVTRMTQGACNAYAIEFGAKRFPFGAERQVLVYEPETRELLLRLLESGLASAPPRGGARGPTLDPAIDVRGWEWERSRWLYAGATTSRFFSDATFTDKETAFLVWPQLKAALEAWRRGLGDRAWVILERIENNFPRMCARFPEFLRLRMALAAARRETRIVDRCEAQLALVNLEWGRSDVVRSVTRYLARGYPAALRLKATGKLLGDYWKRKHRIPRKMFAIAKRLATRRHRA